MCKLASFVLTKDRVYWSAKSDSHEDIIREHKLHSDGVGGPNILRVEISPPSGNLSLPTAQWIYRVDQDITPEWATESQEARTRMALADWTKSKLSGWNVKEAFAPVHPFKIRAKRMSEKRKIELLRQWVSVWDSVRDSVGDSVWASVRDSVRDSVWDSVGDSVGASVWASMWENVGASVWTGVWSGVSASVWYSVVDNVRASVWAYVGSLFVPRITSWRYAEKLGANPWKPLAELWHAGYIPSFDGAIWRLHTGEKAKIVLRSARRI